MENTEIKLLKLLFIARLRDLQIGHDSWQRHGSRHDDEQLAALPVKYTAPEIHHQIEEKYCEWSV